jgi:hypothetical protein
MCLQNSGNDELKAVFPKVGFHGFPAPRRLGSTVHIGPSIGIQITDPPSIGIHGILGIRHFVDVLPKWAILIG